MNKDALYQLHEKAKLDLDGGPQFNWSLDFECAAAELDGMEISDVRDIASMWRSETPSPQLYFTHRQYYKNGIQHIIEELQSKPTSNRALYSLISQDQINESGDGPLPSFLVLQCQLDDGNLYCTCYFRALEVHSFLRVNLEEIRQTLSEICHALGTVKSIRLKIFAFHAYIDKSRLPLQKPEIETLLDDEIQIMLMAGAQDPVKRLDRLLLELRNATTIVSSGKLVSLKRIIERDAPNARLHDSIITLRPLLRDQLTAAIAAATKLLEIRTRASRGPSAEAGLREYQESLDKLRKTLNA